MAKFKGDLLYLGIEGDKPHLFIGIEGDGINPPYL